MRDKDKNWPHETENEESNMEVDGPPAAMGKDEDKSWPHEPENKAPQMKVDGKDI